MAGKGGRSAKGGRGKKGGNPRDPKTIRTVKASELEEISSDEEGEPDTVHVLRALLHGSGSSGSATDFVKKKRQKAEKVHVECDPDQLKLLQTVLKDHKREEEKRKEQEMATAVAEVVLARLGQEGIGTPRTDDISDATNSKTKKKEKKKRGKAPVTHDEPDTSEQDECGESPVKQNRYQRVKGLRDRALARAEETWPW